MSGQEPLWIKRQKVEIDLSVLDRIRNLGDACGKCAELAACQDKVVAADTGIDAPTWSRIKDGSAGVKGEFLERLMDACGNELPLLYLLHKRGYDPDSLRRYESDVERENRALKAANAEKDRKYELLLEVLKDTRSVT